MRSYENSGYNPYNDNYRSQTRSSARNYYSDENDLTNRMQRAHGSNDRSSMGMGAGRDSYGTSGYGGTSTYGRSAGSSNYGSSNYGSGYGSGSNYGSSGSYGSSNTRYSSDNDRYGRSNDNSWGDRIENSWERTKNRVSNAWDNMTDDDDRDNYRSGSSYNRGSYNRGGSSYGSGMSSGMGSGSSYGSSNYGSNYGSGSGNYGSGSNYGSSGSNYGSSNYGSGSYGSSSYGSGYGSGSNYGSSNLGSTNYGSSGSNYGSSGYGSSGSNYGRSYDSDRYSSNDWNNDRDNDRGFFDRAGDEIRSWFGDEEAERRRRMDEMRDREHDNDYNRYGSSSGSTQSGPPYSYGSSSRRDYEW